MQKKYPALRTISICLEILAVIVIVGGVGISLGILLQGDRESLSRLFAIAGMIGSLVVGIIIYAYAELINCLVDIESNTRATEFNTRPKNSIIEKQRQIAELQSQVAEELKNNNPKST